jgi:hypothetical protein
MLQARKKLVELDTGFRPKADADMSVPVLVPPYFIVFVDLSLGGQQINSG